jgi:hypothetical protein
MNQQRNDIIKFVGGIIFIFFCFLLMSAVFETPNNSSNHIAEVVFQSNSHAHSNAINVVQPPSFHKDWVSIFDKMNFTFFNEQLKIFADNRTVHQKFQLLQVVEFSIKPVILCRLQYNCRCIDTEVLPILS